jgi:hypothetical protein
VNDEAQITNAKGMRKSEAQEPRRAKDAFLDEDPEWVVRENSERNRVYDLEERMARFGEAIIDFANTIRENWDEAKELHLIF